MALCIVSAESTQSSTSWTPPRNESDLESRTSEEFEDDVEVEEESDAQSESETAAAKQVGRHELPPVVEERPLPLRSGLRPRK